MKTKSFILLLVLTLMLVLTAGSITHAAPETITGVSFNPTSGPPGISTQMTINFTAAAGGFNAFCIYTADAEWNSNFPTPVTSALTDSYTKDVIPTACPIVAGFTATKYSTPTAHAFAPFGDVLNINVVVPAVTAGTKAFIVQQYSNTGMTTLVNTLNGFFTVNAAATPVYAESSGSCSGTPCFNVLQDAINAVADNGVVIVESIFTEDVTINPTTSMTLRNGSPGGVTGSGGGAAITVSGGTVNIVDGLTINQGSSTRAIAVAGSTVTINGNSIVGDVETTDASASATLYCNNIDGGTAAALYKFSGSSVTAYANNITNTGSAGVDTSIDDGDVPKNWWGTYSSKPTNVDNGDWGVRLGADVANCEVGTGTVTLGSAQMTGGTGTAVIMDFGSGSANAPFGVGITPYDNQSCSNYYDFYTLSSVTDWTVMLPVNTGTAGCVDNTLNAEKVFMVTPGSYDTDCAVSTNADCWDLVSAGNVAVDGTRFQITGMDLSATHFVSGGSDGLDPTAINLLGAGAGQNQTAQAALLAVVLFGLAVTGAVVWRRRSH